MSEITLEKVDIVRERTGVSYQEAKDALEMSQGSVVDALIYLENKSNTKYSESYTTKDEFFSWIKETVKKGNVTRIKIKKDDKVLVDIPVNAGIAVTGIVYLVAAPLLALGVLTAVVTKITVEITKEDGTVEVINKLIQNKVSDVKDKFEDITEDSKFKSKVNDFAEEFKEKFINISEEFRQKVDEVTEEVKEKLNKKQKDDKFEGNMYKYTVNFEEVDEEADENKPKEEEKINETKNDEQK